MDRVLTTDLNLRLEVLHKLEEGPLVSTRVRGQTRT